MTDPRPDPVHPADDTARALGHGLLRVARHCALATTDTATGAPYVARIAVWHDGTAPLILVSTLSHHTRHLQADPRAALLIGEPGPKGDPLTHPRLTLQGRFAPADKAALRSGWLARHPKSKLYYDFTDFLLMRMTVGAGHLNAGFGKAYLLTPDDLG